MSEVRKYAAVIPVTDEMLADSRGFVDWLMVFEAASEAAEGERYNGVFQRGYQAGADAAFHALLDYVNRGGRVGLPMSPDSLHIVDEAGRTGEILSLLALRPWGER